YVTIKGKEKTIANIKKASLSSSSIFLAPDPDREGEAISWHLAYYIKKEPIHRLILHKITNCFYL
ncbi:MAG: toprim domain-containing protein, partial [bacterium]